MRRSSIVSLLSMLSRSASYTILPPIGPIALELMLGLGLGLGLGLDLAANRADSVGADVEMAQGRRK